MSTPASDVEVDLEDLLTNPFNTQPPSLDDLQRLTGFRRDWIMFLYRNFKQVNIYKMRLHFFWCTCCSCP